jgi:hypothetical protein
MQMLENFEAFPDLFRVLPARLAQLTRELACLKTTPAF